MNRILLSICIALPFISIAQPSITSVSPLKGEVGSTVNITGQNFSTTATDNIVYFGAVRATVSTATNNSLSVIVPTGATYSPLSVTVDGRNAYSTSLFMPTFTGLGIFNDKSFEAPMAIPATTNVFSVILGDIDNDGKPDVSTTTLSSTLVSVMRNTSTPGSVSFSPKVDFTAGVNPKQVIFADVSGDGTPDLITANDLGHSISILKNTSSPGSISFNEKLHLASGPNVYSVAAGDFDKDGLADLVSANMLPGTISVFRNTTVGGTLSFAPKIDYESGDMTSYVVVGDLDGDGLQDIISANFDNFKVSLFRNTSTPGNISFAAKMDFDVILFPGLITLADLDQDGKTDIINATTPNSTFIRILRNTSTPGNLSFVSQHLTINWGDFSSIGDVDGNGKPDMIFAGPNNSNVNVMRNTSVPGTISFLAGVQFLAGNLDLDRCAVGDLDGDGKPDIVANRRTSSTVAVLRNTVNEALVQSSGSNPVTGPIIKTTWFDPVVQTHNGYPYVQRHYDINPALNPGTSTGTITIYFTQQDFNQFNEHPSHGADLPTGPLDNANKANLRVFQYHGTSTTGVPGSYTGSGVEINPDDNKIVWDAVNLNWAVTFDVDGFSGFFVGSAGSSILPLQLISFTGKQQGEKILLEWTTTDEENLDRFEVQRSIDGSAYLSIGEVDAKGQGNTISKYSFPAIPVKNQVNFYRLKMIDIDGKYTYSHVVLIKPNTANNKITLYPNPATNHILIAHHGLNKPSIQVVDMTGRLVKSIQPSNNGQITKVELTGIQNGIYTIIVKTNGLVLTERVLIFSHK